MSRFAAPSVRALAARLPGDTGAHYCFGAKYQILQKNQSNTLHPAEFARPEAQRAMLDFRHSVLNRWVINDQNTQ